MNADPDTYTHGHHETVLRAHRWRTAENSAAYLLPHLRPGLSLLDVGCGPGTLTVDLARLVSPGPAIGLDVSLPAIDDARRRGEEAGIDNLTFECRDFRDPGLEEVSYDVVHAHQVVQHLRDRVDAVATMARLVRPGGVLAIREADYAAMTWAPGDDRLTRWLDMMRAVMRHNGGEPDAGRWLLTWAHAAGLADVTYTTSTWTFATPADRDWWGSQWVERTVASSLAEQAVRYGIATQTELAAIAAGWREWAREPDAVFVVVHGELIVRR